MQNSNDKWCQGVIRIVCGVIDDCSGWHGWRETRKNRPVLHNNVSVLMYGGEKDEVILPHRPKKNSM